MIRELDAPGSVLLELAARAPARYPVLFDSAARGPLARCTVLVAAQGGALWRDAVGGLHVRGVDRAGLAAGPASGFLDVLQAWFRSVVREPARPPAEPAALWPGGWAVFLGYEIAAEIEPHLRLPAAAEPCSAFALRAPAALVHDLASGRVFAVAEPGTEDLLEQICRDVAGCGAAPDDVRGPLASSVVEEPPELYLQRVQRVLEFIAAGDIYQANVARAWRADLAAGVGGADLYRALRRANPAPFAAWARFAGLEILSSSPERLLKLDSGIVSTRPIAGTRARSRVPGQDAHEAAALAAHPKERAEHVMLIDLERNDLGRVCEAGSVRVDEYMTTESYEHVHHIVSSVSGKLRAPLTAIDALRAVFPGGTITGCPKVRCMEIIAELEGCGRGPYTGSLGMLGVDGRADFNILIRTMSLSGRCVTLRAGAGIVADSEPQNELAETCSKARGLLAAFTERA